MSGATKRARTGYDLVLPGKLREMADQSPEMSFETLKPFGLSVRATSVPVDGLSRDATDTVELAGMADDDLVEIRRRDGVRLWLSAAELQAQARDCDPKSVAADKVDLAQIFRSGTDRGDTLPLLDRVTRLEVDLGQLLVDAGIGALAERAAMSLVERMRIAEKLTRFLEAKKLAPGRDKPARPGLYALRSDFSLTEEPVELVDAAGKRPILVFIHGTHSNTLGSFGGLKAGRLWPELWRRYADRVFALEHPTLSSNPAENALDLLRCLPRDATLHLVTHSRGGLVGEWLCLAPLLDQSDFSSFERLPDRPEGEIAIVQELQVRGRERTPKIERFVRVAGPGRGTLLAGDRLSRYFSVVLNLMGMVPALRSNPVYPMVQAAALALIKLGFEARTVPGLACLRPDSPYVQRLHVKRALLSDSDLTIIAGNHGGEGILGRLGRILEQPSQAPWSLADLAADLFFRESNDLVIESRSMFAGLPRKNPARYAFRQSASAHHFDYFRSDIGQDLLQRALLDIGDAPDAQFRSLSEDLETAGPAPTTVRAEKVATPGLAPTTVRAPDDADIVILVPDFMASRLVRAVKDPAGPASGAEPVVIWPDALDEGPQGWDPLDLRDSSNPTLRPNGALDAVYAELRAELGARYRLEDYAYDWRRAPRDAAAGLARLVSDLAAAFPGRTIHLIAHGLGATVVGWLQEDHASAWTALRESGGRALLVGPLAGGSFEMLRHLAGQSELVRALALRAMREPEAVAQAMGAWPGLLAALPAEVLHPEAGNAGGKGRAVARSWARIVHAAGVPAALLDEARAADLALHEGRKGHPTDPEGQIVLLGTAPWTPIGVQGDGEGPEPSPGPLAFTVSTQGDGVATWDGALRPGQRSYFVNAPHGGLLAHLASGSGLVDLLERGQSRLLSTVRPAVSVRGEIAGTMPPAEALYPSLRDVLSAGHLVRRQSPVDRAAERLALQVEVAHGDLANASYPVAVGHFQGSTIDGAEGYIDRLLEGRLTRRELVGLYPGEVGRAEVLLNMQPGGLPGCMIVGLGEIGDLTPQKLTRGFTEAALRYATLVAERERNPDGRWRSAAISTVLIGTAGTRALGIESSIEAIVRAVVDANERLMDRELWDEVRIDALQFVELYSETAIRAAKVVRGLDRQIQLPKGSRQDLEPAHYLRWIQNGRAGQPSVDYNEGSWQPVTIASEAITGSVWARLSDDLRQLLVGVLGGKSDLAPPGERVGLWRELLFGDDDPARRDLVWSMLGTRARAEQSTGALQRRLVDQLIEQATVRGDTLEAMRVTLYELLLPNAIKVQSGDLSHLVLELDDTTATYPWELLSERMVPPIAVRVGVLRRLRTQRYRERVRHSTSRTALVIGDPPTGDPRYPPLSGARAEAAAVKAALDEAGFHVVAYEPPPAEEGGGADAIEVMNKLFEDDWRVLHIAAHGRYDAEQPIASGVVIGPDTYITAAEISRLRVVPELVFLNCCHLGKQDPEPRVLADRPRLAASLARELIEMGVRAVVATGWAVDDLAARRFAEDFYARMLEGDPFGEAVLQARRTVFNEFGLETNTWGAYQCYGDPGFRLATPPARSFAERVDPIARRELQNHLKEIKRQAIGSTPGQAESLFEELRELESLAEGQGWFGSTVWSQFGEAYAELGNFEAAIRCYEKALASQAAHTPLAVIEQLANLAARQALQMHARTGGGRVQGVEDLMELARRNVRVFEYLPETAERWSLRGSLAKREALLAAGAAARRKHLAAAGGHYAQALECRRRDLAAPDAGPAGEQVDPYATLNALTCDFLLGLDADPPPPDAQVKHDLDTIDRCLAALAAEGGRRVHRDFWTRVAEADAGLLRALILRDLPAQVDLLRGQYLSIFRSGSSPRQRLSVTEHIAFLRAMLPDRSKAWAHSVVCLQQLHDDLARFGR